MRGNRLKTWHLFVIFVIVIAITGWNFDRYVDIKEKVMLETGNLAKCKKVSKEIREYKRGPTLVLGEEMQLTVLNKRIESAVKQAKIPVKNIGHITQENSRRMEDSPYRLKPIKFDLHEVTLKQLITALHELSYGEFPFRIRSIRLKAPREVGKEEIWSTEMTLTYLVYTSDKSDV